MLESIDDWDVAHPALVCISVKFLLHLQPYVHLASHVATDLVQRLFFLYDIGVCIKVSRGYAGLSPRLRHYVQMGICLGPDCAQAMDLRHSYCAPGTGDAMRTKPVERQARSYGFQPGTFRTTIG